MFAVLVTLIAPCWSVLVNVQVTCSLADNTMALIGEPSSHVALVNAQLAGTGVSFTE